MSAYGKAVKVRFLQTGGFAGLLRGCTLDTAEMDSTEGRTLRALVDQLSFKESEEGGDRSARDVVAYEITVEDGKRTRSLRFEDLSVPEPVKPLLAFLQARSSPLVV